MISHSPINKLTIIFLTLFFVSGFADAKKKTGSRNETQATSKAKRNVKLLLGEWKNVKDTFYHKLETSVDKFHGVLVKINKAERESSPFSKREKKLIDTPIVRETSTLMSVDLEQKSKAKLKVIRVNLESGGSASIILDRRRHVTLLDTGYSTGDAKKIEIELNSLFKNKDYSVDIIITHNDADHTGGLTYFLNHAVPINSVIMPSVKGLSIPAKEKFHIFSSKLSHLNKTDDGVYAIFRSEDKQAPSSTKHSSKQIINNRYEKVDLSIQLHRDRAMRHENRYTLEGFDFSTNRFGSKSKSVGYGDYKTTSFNFQKNISIFETKFRKNIDNKMLAFRLGQDRKLSTNDSSIGTIFSSSRNRGYMDLGDMEGKKLEQLSAFYTEIETLESKLKIAGQRVTRLASKLKIFPLHNRFERIHPNTKPFRWTNVEFPFGAEGEKKMIRYYEIFRTFEKALREYAVLDSLYSEVSIFKNIGVLTWPHHWQFKLKDHLLYIKLLKQINPSIVHITNPINGRQSKLYKELLKTFLKFVVREEKSLDFKINYDKQLDVLTLLLHRSGWRYVQNLKFDHYLSIA